MKRNKPQSGLWNFRHAQRLVNWRKTFSEQVVIDVLDDPREPVMSVSDAVMSIRTAGNNLRLHIFLPWVIAFWFLSFKFIADFGPNSGEIAYANSNIQEKLEYDRQGINYDPADFAYYQALVGSDGKGSIPEYIYAVSKFSTERHRNTVYGELVYTSATLLIAIILTTRFICARRPAEIYFDRKRDIVYTWRLGKIAACRFDNLGFRETQKGMQLFLYGENTKRNDGYWPTVFRLQPTGAVYFNREDDNTPLMMKLFTFMDKGKSALITGESFDREQSDSYLYTDDKPSNFEQRLQAILAREHELVPLYEKYTF